MAWILADTPIEEFTPTPAFPALQYLESVDEGGVAWKAGLRTGDFLIEVRSLKFVLESLRSHCLLKGWKGPRSAWKSDVWPMQGTSSWACCWIIHTLVQTGECLCTVWACEYEERSCYIFNETEELRDAGDEHSWKKLWTHRGPSCAKTQFSDVSGALWSGLHLNG